jgi:transposase InsO family protein
VWSYDFLTERTEDGRQLRILVVIDEFTRECLAIEVARSFTACDVIMTLQYLFAVRGAPEHLRSDNGPEFVASDVAREGDDPSRTSLPLLPRRE